MQFWCNCGITRHVFGGENIFCVVHFKHVIKWKGTVTDEEDKVEAKGMMRH